MRWGTPRSIVLVVCAAVVALSTTDASGRDQLRFSWGR
jgi:hypothetical protein